MVRQQLIQGVDDFRTFDLAGGSDVRGKIAPEIAKHIFPRELAGGDAVELLLEISGEVELDVALEEILEIGGDDAALVLRHEPLALEADILALPQRLHRRGVGRGSPDA